MSIRLVLALPLAGLPLALAAHSVSEPTVAARMMLMTDVAAETKTLGNMAKGAAPFDAATANAALTALEAAAKQMPARFETKADHPESEALPTIWTDWDRFVRLSEAMAKTAATSVETREDLTPVVAALGGTCRDCHKSFRE